MLAFIVNWIFAPSLYQYLDGLVPGLGGRRHRLDIRVGTKREEAHRLLVHALGDSMFARLCGLLLQRPRGPVGGTQNAASSRGSGRYLVEAAPGEVV
jgi:hypothetical protein